jgi:hypothetical protein
VKVRVLASLRLTAEGAEIVGTNGLIVIETVAVARRLSAVSSSQSESVSEPW